MSMPRADGFEDFFPIFYHRCRAGIVLADEVWEKRMPQYTPVDNVTRRLNVTEAKLRELESFGWISITEKNGVLWVPGRHEYKAKFILHLQRVLKLNPQQISKVLLAEEPPYSLKDVDRILAERPDGNDANEESVHEGSLHVRR